MNTLLKRAKIELDIYESYYDLWKVKEYKKNINALKRIIKQEESNYYEDVKRFTITGEHARLSNT